MRDKLYNEIVYLIGFLCQSWLLILRQTYNASRNLEPVLQFIKAGNVLVIRKLHYTIAESAPS